MQDNNELLQLLHSRVSVPQLTGPGPNEQQLNEIIRSALRAPDHARLRPWKYLCIREQGQKNLGQLFASSQAVLNPQLSPEQLQKFKKMPMRAPILIAAIADCKPHDKVPEIEQLLSAGAGVQNILLASYALGFGAIWRTGAMVNDLQVLKALGITEQQSLIGFIYIGHANCKLKQPPEIDVEQFMENWEGPVE